MSDDDKKNLEQQLEDLPSSTKAFVEGYGEGTAGWKPEPGVPKSHAEGLDASVQAQKGYRFNLGGATNRVCLRCGSVVADFDLHDRWHDKIDRLIKDD